MSRTRKTAPWFVKFFYDPVFLEPEHDHRFHECNLPPRPTKKDARNVKWYGGNDRPCFWWYSHAFSRSSWSKCPCYMCSYDAYETPRRLRERREGKRYCQDAWKDEY